MDESEYISEASLEPKKKMRNQNFMKPKERYKLNIKLLSNKQNINFSDGGTLKNLNLKKKKNVPKFNKKKPKKLDLVDKKFIKKFIKKNRDEKNKKVSKLILYILILKKR